jgi:hypothetical protein
MLDISEESWDHWVHSKMDWMGDKIERWEWATDLWMECIFPNLEKFGFCLNISKHVTIRKFLWFWKAIHDNSYEAIDYVNGVPYPRLNSNIISLPVPKVPITLKRGEEHALAALHCKKLEDYRNVFEYKFTYELFEKISEFYEAGPCGFDDSWTGRTLRADLPNFIFAYMDLRQSPAIQKYEAEEAESEAYYKQIESSHLTLEELDKMRKRGEMDPDYVYDKHE